MLKVGAKVCLRVKPHYVGTIVGNDRYKWYVKFQYPTTEEIFEPAWFYDRELIPFLDGNDILKDLL